MITYENTKTVYQLVKQAEEAYGDKIFLKYEENDEVFKVTYKTFVLECLAVAAWVREQNAKAGYKVKVGLLGSSSHLYLDALLGIMCSGNVAVPLDIQMDVNGLSDCLNRADVDILFYDWEHAALVEGVKANCPHVGQYISLQHGKHVPCVDKIIKRYKGCTLENESTEEECAMILFTSGTTGAAKGVMLSNGNLMDNTFCTTDTAHPENEIYLNVLPIHHVFCINGDIFIVMRYGSTLCLNQDMSKLAAHIQLFQPSVIRMVPMIAKALYNRMVMMESQDNELSLEEIRRRVLGPRLHKIISGGGYLMPELADYFGRFGVKIAQGYGMSECAPKIAAPDWNRIDKVASVGKIVDRCQVKVVDGEIWVKSPSVMMGYYKDQERTAEVMTKDGWLCTGDLGYIDDENFLYLTGRKKNLIILSNGENVAPEQLENLFVEDNLVEEILVFGENDTIMAEIYPNFKYAEVAHISNVEKVIGEIIKIHNEALPSFKRIMKWRLRDTPFPKTSSKKIIRKAYFNQKAQEENLLAHLKMPENEVQQMVYDCVSKALGHCKFGIDTDIYAAGLDSLGSVMLLSDLYEKLHLSICLKDLMHYATVEKLEALTKEAVPQTDVDYSVRAVYPLSNLQCYFAYVMRGNTTGNLPFLFKLDEQVDLVRLKGAILETFEAHPSLKGIIQLSEGIYKTFRDDTRAVEIPITELTNDQWEIEQKHLLKPFMYTEDEPLYHVGLYKTESAKYLFFDIAHIIGDGMTMNILFEDINAFYCGKPVVKESYTFYEYILDIKDRENKGICKQNEEYFYELLKGFKIHKSILNHKGYQDLSQGENAILRKDFTRLNKKEILAFCSQYGVSENVIFLTAYNYCIGIFSNEKDAVSTSIHSGRTDSRWSRLSGALFLTYLFRYTNKPHETVPQLLQRSGKQIMDTMKCSISTLHADEMFFQYQGEILNIDEIGGAPAERIRMKLDALPFHLQVMSRENGYYYELRYWKNRFDEKQLAVFMDCLEVIVAAMLEEPSVRRLKKHLPDSVFPRHYFIEARAVNEAAGYKLVDVKDEQTKVKAYVFDETCRKQPYGGWGNLYIMDVPVNGEIDKITNPYGKGILHQTKHIARILPDGALDILEKGGRTILQESITGRHFLDLQKLEDILCQYEGIQSVKAYSCYAEGNKFKLAADVYGDALIDKDQLNAYLEAHCDKELVPQNITFYLEEESKQEA